MMRAMFKVFSVFITVVAVAMMGAALSAYFVRPDARAEMNTAAMLNYTFEEVPGENPQWRVVRRFTTNPGDPSERGTVGSFASPYQALVRAHADLKNYLTQNTAPLVADKTRADEETRLFEAGQKQDLDAIAARVAVLNQVSEQLAVTLRTRSEELQASSVKSRELGDEIAARRTDVLRLRHEIEEARTDLFRLRIIRRDLMDRLVRLEIENQEMTERYAQLAHEAGASDQLSPVEQQN